MVNEQAFDAIFGAVCAQEAMMIDAGSAGSSHAPVDVTNKLLPSVCAARGSAVAQTCPHVACPSLMRFAAATREISAHDQ
jgi:hypothetical protein